MNKQGVALMEVLLALVILSIVVTPCLMSVSHYVQAQKTVELRDRVAPVLLQNYAQVLMNKTLGVAIEEKEIPPFTCTTRLANGDSHLEQYVLTVAWREHETPKEFTFVTEFAPYTP
jgi:prepilin-type N-terminal cleavage/methylation domain-containing protein